MLKSPTTPGALISGLLATLELAAEGENIDLASFLKAVDHVGHGTTAATNAFIERRGARLGLLTTYGFEDTLFQQRMMGMTAGLSRDEVTDYSRRAVPEPLCLREHVYGIRERIDYAGRVLLPLQEDDVRAAAASFADDGVDAVAICFLWSFKQPAHEQRAAEILATELPNAYVTTSSELVPRIGEYERMATTVVNAFVGPTIARYTDTLEQNLAEFGARPRILLLDSAGGVVAPKDAGKQAVRLLVSGPSGGLTASRVLGSQLSNDNVITFDMGGTSTDVGLIVDGVPLQRRDTVADKYHLLMPMVDINAIGAGGGSIARVEHGRYLHVGPQSAGADPGPACYGRGGELPTVTDADLVLGILDPERFLGGRLALDRVAADRALRKHVAEPLGISVEEAAIGVKRIVDNRMADLLRTVTIQRGYDPREFVLYAYGGAGPTHAPAFALELVDTVVVPATQSVHSAFGAISSDLQLVFERSEPMRFPRTGGATGSGAIESIFEELEGRAHAALAEQDVPTENRSIDRVVEMRYARQAKELRVRASRPTQLDDLIADFEELYARRYGAEAVPQWVGFELVTFTVEARGQLRRPELRRSSAGASGAKPVSTRSVFNPEAAAFVPTPIYEGDALAAGDQIDGPAIIEYAGTTVALLGEQQARVDELLNIVIARSGS